MEIDMARIISLVEERPVLWDKSFDGYKDRKGSFIAWQEIAREVYDEYDSLDDKEKNELSTIIMKKWTNVKDNWVRFQKRMMEETISGSTKQRKYIYHKQLAFLQKNNRLYDAECSSVENDSQDVQVTGTSKLFGRFSQRRSFPKFIKGSPAKNDSRDSQAADSTKFSDHTSYTRPIPTNKGQSTESDWDEVQIIESPDFSERTSHHRNFPTFSKGIKRKREDIEEKILKTLSTPEDRHMCFFKGILPSLHQLNEDEVLQFQVGVMDLLQTIRKARTTVEHADLSQIGIVDYTGNSGTAYPIIVNCQGSSAVIENDSQTRLSQRLQTNQVSPSSYNSDS